MDDSTNLTFRCPCWFREEAEHMFHIRIQVLATVLFLPVAQTAALADYISQTVGLSSTAPNPISGSVQIEAYDGKGSAGGGLNAGQVRVTFHANAPIGNV